MWHPQNCPTFVYHPSRTVWALELKRSSPPPGHNLCTVDSNLGDMCSQSQIKGHCSNMRVCFLGKNCVVEYEYSHGDASQHKHFRFCGLSKYVGTRLCFLISRYFTHIPKTFCLFAMSSRIYCGECLFSGKCMFLSGLLPRPMSADDDSKLLQYGIGFTNIVERTTRGSANLTRKEIEDGESNTLVELSQGMSCSLRHYLVNF